MSQNVWVSDHAAIAKSVEPADHYILQPVHKHHPIKWEKLASVRLQMHTLERYASDVYRIECEDVALYL
jgi:hypothetical protein